MVSFHDKHLHTQVKEAVAGFGKSAVKLIAIHAGISVGANLLLTLISYLLDMGIAGTGGLSGIGTRALLETVQQFLQTVLSIALPFWEMGYVFSALQMARGQGADSVNLLTGFRHFGPVLRTHVLRWVVYFALIMFGAQIASLVFMLTPAAKDMMAATEALMESIESMETIDYAALLSNETYMQAMQPAIPFMVAGALIPLIPFLYRMRMMDFVLMDEPRKGAFHAFGMSMRMTRKRCMTILKLDLHFWWYYLLQILTVALCYADLWLPLIGVELNMEASVAALVFYAVALLCELGLYVWQKNRVTATYVLLYDQLRKPQIPVQKPMPTNVPWDC